MEKMAHFFPFKATRKSWIELLSKVKNPSFILLALILLVASFLRLYRIADYMTFLGDEGRDVMVAKEILEGNLTLLGPRASAGDFFLGPVYYYMIAPFLWLFNYDPVGPAIMVALFGIATVFLVYFISSKFFGKRVGLIASFLYALSPLVIAYSRSSWNPNPVPFFTLLMLYLLYLGVVKKSIKFLFIVGILIGVLFQLHYITTFLAVIVAVFVLFANIILRQKNIFKIYIQQYLSIFVGFILGFSPFLLFEFRHGFPNIQTIFSFIFVDNFQGEEVQNVSHFAVVHDVLFRLFARLLVNFPPPEQIPSYSPFDLLILKIFIYSVIAGSVVALIATKKRIIVFLLLLWMLGGVFLFGFYKGDIYDYYYGFLFPVPFILVGNLIVSLLKTGKRFKYIGAVLGVIVFAFISYRLFSEYPFQHTPNKQKAQAEKIADIIIDKTDGKPYNFALITLGNSDHVYRYFLEVKNHPPLTIENSEVDPQRKTVTDQLIVVCEGPCSPLGNSLWEVAGFGRAELVGEWKVSVVTIYKLVPYGRD